MVQAWRRAFPSGPHNPTTATVRALIAGTARDMVGAGPGTNPTTGQLTVYPKGPDFATGYGELDVARAVALILASGKGESGFTGGSVAGTGRTVNFKARLKGKTISPLSFTLTWDDPPGEPGASSPLQNDLDLKVIAPDGKTHFPWKLDHKSPTTPAGQGIDRLNNLEQVPLPAPAAGTYLISVSGHLLAKGPQPFALVLSGVSALDGPLELDLDGDGYFKDDCDDTNPKINPGAKELPGNGLDDDCDKSTPDTISVDAGTPDVTAPADLSQKDSGGTPDRGGLLLGGGGGSCSVEQGVGGVPICWALLLLLALRRRSL